jgi:hypothetical protein
VNRPGLVQTVDSRPAVSTGVGVILVLAGVILRFAVDPSAGLAMNAHVAAVIVMLVGVLALLLPLLVWGPLNRRRNRPGGMADLLAEQRIIGVVPKRCSGPWQRP